MGHHRFTRDREIVSTNARSRCELISISDNWSAETRESQYMVGYSRKLTLERGRSGAAGMFESRSSTWMTLTPAPGSRELAVAPKKGLVTEDIQQ